MNYCVFTALGNMFFSCPLKHIFACIFPFALPMPLGAFFICYSSTTGVLQDKQLILHWFIQISTKMQILTLISIQTIDNLEEAVCGYIFPIVMQYCCLFVILNEKNAVINRVSILFFQKVMQSYVLLYQI